LLQCNKPYPAALHRNAQKTEAEHYLLEMLMYVTPEQIAATNKAGVEALLGLANSQFAAFERWSTLNMNATKAAFEDSMNHAKALLGAKDVQEFINVNAAAAQPALEKAIAYSRSIYEVAAQSQAEMTKAVEAQASELNKNVVTFLDKVSKNAPAGSDVAVAAVKQALAAANSAYDSFTKVAKQATEIAEANFTAVTTAAKETRKKVVGAAA
jgi:phasin family protein